jgi:hypothetical protein
MLNLPAGELKTKNLTTSTISGRTMNNSNDTLKNELQAVMSRAAEIWNTQHYGQLKTLWDVSDGKPFYLPEEHEDWVNNWSDLEDYWEPTPGARLVEAIFLTYTVDDAKFLSDDIAMAIGWVRHDMKMVFRKKAWGGEARLNATFRKRDGEWKLVAYCEAPITGAMYLQRLMEGIVRPEFNQLHAEIMERDKEMFAGMPRFVG